MNVRVNQQRSVMKIIFLTFCIVLCTNAVKVTYENFKVYNVIPNTNEQFKVLKYLNEDNTYDFWTEVFDVGSKVRVMVNPKSEEDFLSRCEVVGMKPEVSIANLQEFINETMKPTTSRSTKNLGSFNWERYYTVDEIYAWLDELVELYPDVVSIVVAGNTYEDRQIKGVKIDFKPNDRDEKPLSGMIEGGIHSREWISPATVTWIIKEFLTSTDADVRHMAETFVWHIFPVVNPDGYAYSFTDNRMWRKNRNPSYFTNCFGDDDISRGVDLNRNFDFMWMSVGASLNPCLITYAGPSPASELETKAISSYVINLNANSNLIYYIAFHSYSQLIIVPYSHVTESDKLQVTNYADVFEVAMRGSEKLSSVYNSAYTVGVASEILYAVSGSSMDWAKSETDVPMAFLFELRDVGEYGFLLPTEQIVPNNEEIMACLVEMDKTTEKLGYFSRSGSSVLVHSVFVLLTSIACLLQIN